MKVSSLSMVTHYWPSLTDIIFLTKDIPITDPFFWQNEQECTLESLRHVFRSCTEEEIPLLEERLDCLREAGQVLCKVG
jgi:hypothetical protein